MSNKRIGGFIITFTGRRYWPLDPRPEEVSIIDIAHSLAGQNRFGSHTGSYINTAQHAVEVSCCPMLSTVVEKQCGLLHDSGEADLIDLPSPVKQHVSFRAEFERIEDMNRAAHHAHFGLPWPMPDDLAAAVKAADQWALRNEQSRFMREFGGTECAWSAAEANLRFLERFIELWGDVR